MVKEFLRMDLKGTNEKTLQVFIRINFKSGNMEMPILKSSYEQIEPTRI